MKYQYILQLSTIREIETAISKNKDLFDEDVFKKWYDEKGIEFMNFPDRYVMKCFEDKLKKGEFQRQEIVPNLTPLFNDMRKWGIEMYEDDVLYISVMERRLINDNQVTQQELIDLNHLAINYIIGKFDKPTTVEFIMVFKKSKRNFDFTKIDEEYEHEKHKKENN